MCVDEDNNIIYNTLFRSFCIQYHHALQLMTEVKLKLKKYPKSFETMTYNTKRFGVYL